MRKFHELQAERFIFHFKEPMKGTVAVIFMSQESGRYDAFYGISICSKKDQFCRKIGVSVATGRAKQFASGQFKYTTPLKAGGQTAAFGPSAETKAKAKWAAEVAKKVFEDACIWM